jgi:hypothetical protein
VDDPLGVRGAERVASLRDDLHHARHRELPRLAQQLPQVAPLEELHHHVRGAVLEAAHVHHFHDVLVADGRRRERLAVEALKDRRVVRVLRVQTLDRDAALDQNVLALIDGAHAALTEFLDDPVAVLDHLAQAPVRGGFQRLR